MQSTIVPNDQHESKKSNAVSTQDDGQTIQVVNFHLGSEEYGLDIKTVQEIILIGTVTKVPQVPEYVLGLINLRGKIIPVVDLRLRFGMDAEQQGEHTRIIVLKASGHVIGIVVDAVNEVLRINQDQIEPPPVGLRGLDQTFIKGLVKREEKIMILLSVDTILSHEEHAATVETQPSSAAL